MIGTESFFGFLTSTIYATDALITARLKIIPSPAYALKNA
jgi:hypothetical protein